MIVFTSVAVVSLATANPTRSRSGKAWASAAVKISDVSCIIMLLLSDRETLLAKLYPITARTIPPHSFYSQVLNSSRWTETRGNVNFFEILRTFPHSHIANVLPGQHLERDIIASYALEK